MTKLTLIAAAAAFTLGAPLSASAQVETRDHRKEEAKPAGDYKGKKKKPRPAGPEVRDHRKDRPATVRDHDAKGPVVRDHSKGAPAVPTADVDVKVEVNADRKGPLVRDHRTDKVDWNKRRAEYRVEAERRWKTRKPELAKKEDERREHWKQRREERIKSRAERRAKRQEEIRAAWEARLLAEADVQAELELHARRVARINRLRRLAEIKAKGKLVIRIEIVAQREDDRHQMRMDDLRAKYAAQ